MSSPVLDRWMAVAERHRRRQLEFADRTAGFDAVLTAQLLLSSTVFTGACTPTAVLAWSMPDEEADA